MIQVKDLMVSFNHSEMDAVLKHISVNIYSGEKVALIGKSNAEKHSLVSCLFRFIEPMAGSIKIDGVNIAWVTNNNTVSFICVYQFLCLFFFLDWC